MKWTKEEIQFLIDNYAEGATYCAQQLGRTYSAVQIKASRLNLARAGWSKEEDQFLIENYSEYGPAYCVEQLGKTYDVVTTRASKLNLKTGWSIKEEQFLIDNYAEHGPVYCAEQLGKTYVAVIRKAFKLSLKANTRYDSNIVYAVYFPDLFLYKVGITNNVGRRIKEFGQPCVILKTQECEPTEAAELERKLLKSVTLINTGALNNGNTETFMQPSKEIELFLK
jgi:hypothetical protein